MSIPISVDDAVLWTRGTVAADERLGGAFAGVSINTRTLCKDELFVAIRGETHDAHRFVPQALDAGAGGLLVEQRWLADNDVSADVPVIAVPDTTIALGALAAGSRAGFRGPVVAITGSNGKTTTKEMCHAILSVAAPCLKNQGNLNNEFGLPLTLLSREADQRSAVVELGMNHRGEIARLASIAAPDVAVITNIGTAHIEYLGSREEIAREKGDLIAALGPKGIAAINLDDERVAGQAHRAPGPVITYARERSSDVTAEDVRFEGDGGYAFRLKTPSGDAEVRIRGLAETTVINALAAATAALAARAPLDDIVTGLGRHDHVPGRMACCALPVGARLIDDTYNANPQSVQSAIESLARLKSGGRAFAVLGDMGELGESAEAAHQEVGRLVAEHGIDFLFTLGERSRSTAESAVRAGMNPQQVHIHSEPTAVADGLRELIAEQDWILVKGSRAMQMERVVRALANQETE